jgi:hypothetical protein
MADTNRGDSPGSSDTAVAAAPESGASSLPAEQDFASQVRAANSPAAVRALVDGLKKPSAAPAKPAAAKPAGKLAPDLVAAEKGAETPAEGTPPAEGETAEGAEGTPAGGETPAEGTPEEGAATESAEGAESAESEEDEKPEGEGEEETSVTPTTAKRIRLRLPENDEVGRLASSFMTRNRDWTMEQAIAAAKDKLGIKPEPDQGEAQKGQPKSDGPQSVEEVDRLADKLEDDKEKAMADYRLEDVAKIDRQLRKLDRQRADLQRQEAEAIQEAQAAYNEGFTSSQRRAAELYDFASNPESPGGKRMLEIEATLEETGDDLYYSPDKPLKIAQMVAKELNIAPRRKGAQPAAAAKPAAAAAAAAPGPKKGILPSGGSHTAPAQSQANGVAAEVAKIRTPLELRRFAEKSGLKIQGL